MLAISQWPRKSLFGVLIALVAALAYLGGINASFVAEDFSIIQLGSNQTFEQLTEFILTSARFRPTYYGLSWLEVQLFGTTPTGYHLFGLVLHLFIVLGVLNFAFALTKSGWSAGVAALLYAIYPRGHQAVIWMAANQLLLVTLFSLICCYTFKRYLDTGKRRWLIGAVIGLGLALMSHEVGITLVVLLPCIELMERNDLHILRKPRFYRKYLVYIPLIVIYVVANFAGARAFKLSTQNPESGVLSTQGLTNIETYHFTGLGIEQLKDISATYTYLIFPQIPLRSLDATPITVAIAIIILLGFVLLFVKGTPLVRFGIIWIVVTTLPFTLFVPFGNAERYFYLPAAGLCFVFAGLTEALPRVLFWQAQRTIKMEALALLLCVVIGFVNIQARIADWYSAGRLAEDIIAQTSRLDCSPQTAEWTLIAGLPGSYGQAYVFNIGIRGAMALYTGKTDIQVRQTNDPTVSQFLSQAQPASNPLPNVCIVLYQDGKLTDKSNVVTSLAELKPESWY